MMQRQQKVWKNNNKDHAASSSSTSSTSSGQHYHHHVVEEDPSISTSRHQRKQQERHRSLSRRINNRKTRTKKTSSVLAILRMVILTAIVIIGCISILYVHHLNNFAQQVHSNNKYDSNGNAIVPNQENIQSKSTTTTTTSYKYYYPRQIFYVTNDKIIDLSQRHIPVKMEEGQRQQPLQEVAVAVETMDKCQPMKEWQTQSFPSCNTAHEITLRPEEKSSEIQFISCGGDRCAFKIRVRLQQQQDINDDDDEATFVVIKVPKYKKDINLNAFEKSNKDAVAMERLQFSNFIVDIYGYCGLTQLLEVANDGGHMPLLVRTMKKLSKLDNHQNYDLKVLPMLDRLKIFYHISSGIADMHSFDDNNSGSGGASASAASLVHNDIDIYQFLLVKGIYKLNDFHMSKFQYYNIQTNQTCPSQTGYSSQLKVIRSPEEIKNWGSPHQMLERCDVYNMGNVMYYILTSKWLFEELEFGGDYGLVNKSTKRMTLRDKLEWLTNGKRSPIPTKVLSKRQTDPTINAMITAIEMCWTHNPKERPKAIQIKDYIQKELITILNLKSLNLLSVDDVRIHTIQPYLVEYQTDDDAYYEKMFK